MTRLAEVLIAGASFFVPSVPATVPLAAPHAPNPQGTAASGTRGGA